MQIARAVLLAARDMARRESVANIEFAALSASAKLSAPADPLTQSASRGMKTGRQSFEFFSATEAAAFVRSP